VFYTGGDMLLLNVSYIKPTKQNNEYFEVIYKDDDGNIHKSIEPAEADIYFTKKEYRNYDYNKPQERMDRLEKRKVPISRIIYEIAKEIGDEGKNFINQCFDNKDYKALKRLYGWRYAYGCDFQPEFYFMRDWYSKYQLKNVRLTKAFIDIEVDGIDYTVDLDKLYGTTHAPVICATIFLEEGKECFTFLLRPYVPSKMTYPNPDEYAERYALYENQLAQHNELMNNTGEFIRELNNAFDKTYGRIRYSIREYEHEIDLIADMFRLLNDRKPNFCLAWNMRFDIQYLIERTKILGYDPKSIMCHPDFELKRCYFEIDRSTYKLEKQFDYFYCSSYTHFICQMRNYAAVRKSQQMLKSVALNAIAERELRDRKVEYPDETNIIEFAYKDWKRYVIYNVKD
jgi:hypothetical protein